MNGKWKKITDTTPAKGWTGPTIIKSGNLTLSDELILTRKDGLWYVPGRASPAYSQPTHYWEWTP